MKSLKQVLSRLRNQNLKQYLLFCGSCLFSTLFITLYVSLISSPTVLDVLPKGGDSRQQMMMIFSLAVFGCVTFTIYTVNLFFRYKSREVGILLILGTPTKRVKDQIRKELLFCTIFSSIVGALLAVPCALGIWQMFKMILADSDEMTFVFNVKTYVFSVAFVLFIVIYFIVMVNHYFKSSDIINIINQSRKTEIVKDVPKKYAILGSTLLIIGLLVGYLLPNLIIDVLNIFPPDAISLVGYLPAIFGLYLLLLQRIVGVNLKSKKRYKNIISRNMLKFQGRQTVQTMLITTVLVAGGYFASFYVPNMMATSLVNAKESKIDFIFNYRVDQDMVTEQDIKKLATDYNVTITDYIEQKAVILGIDGYSEVKEQTDLGTTYNVEYLELCRSGDFLSESAYNALTGENIDIQQDEVTAVYDNSGSNRSKISKDINIITNPITKETLQVSPNEVVLKNTELLGYYVLDDSDYMKITTELTNEWEENMVFFNVKNINESYEFATTLLKMITNASSEEVAIDNFYDPIVKMLIEGKGETYFLDREYQKSQGEEIIDLTAHDSSNLLINWKYMPKFAIIEQNDFIKTYAVYLSLFSLIALICFVAVIVIITIRSYTIALTNSQVYRDLRQLGASNRFLLHEISAQIRKVFFLPIFIGTTVIYAYYTMILFFNSGGSFEKSELIGMIINFGVITFVSILFYIVYRITIRKVCSILDIRK